MSLIASAAGVATTGGVIGVAQGEPRLSASGFIGVDWPGDKNELGNSWAPEQVPGTAPLIGARVSWLALPALPANLQVAVEGELAFTPSSTGSDPSSGRTDYFAPVFAWRAQGLVRLARGRVEPHLLVGAGGETIASASPYMSRETDPAVYWGTGARVPFSTAWHVRADLRQGLTAARDGGVTATFELQLGIGTTFGASPARRGTGSIAAAPAAPTSSVATPSSTPAPAASSTTPSSPAPSTAAAQPQPITAAAAPSATAAPARDQDGDGIPDEADQCADRAEDRDGFDDGDGCPDPDNDRDGIADADDACAGAPETVNGFTDDDGCPDAVPDTVATALATRVPFEPNRARVTGPAGAALAPLLAILRGWPELRIAIVGHADRPAGADLAKRRADAVKWYLIDQGIIEGRITTRVAGRDAPRTSVPVTFELVPRSAAPVPSPAQASVQP